MNARFDQLKKVTFALIGSLLLGMVLLSPASAPARATGDDFDAAASYKAKCAMCHGATAEKKFDAAKPEEQLIETVLKGKEGTPKMPAYEKSYTAEQAKALVAYMKSLKK
jgi:mono/diheme cytochrome c family protein